MKPDRRVRRVTAKQAISLLSDPGFRADVKDVRVASGWGSVEEEAVRGAEEERDQKRAAFKAKWGSIIPPPDGALLDDPAPNPRRPEAAALLAGKWGIIRVFPWTSQKTVDLEFRRIRAVIGRAIRERKNAYRSEVARWLQDCGFSSGEIAGAVWNRREGLKRLSRREINRNKRLLDKVDERVKALGEPKAYAAVQGREATAAPMVRMARKRQAELESQRRQTFSMPLEVDPLSGCLMKIIRLKFSPYGLPMVLPASSIAEPLDALLDELRRQLLEGPSSA